MKRLAVAASLLVIGATACGQAAPSAAPLQELSANTARAQRLERTASIDAAVIRELVTKELTNNPDGSPFRTVFVIDGAEADAATTLGSLDTRSHQHPFGPRLKRGVCRLLRDLPPLKFIDHPSSVIIGNPPGRVNNGVLVTLGPIRGGATGAEIRASIWNNGLDAKWLTYVVMLRAGHWQIAGTTGPIAVA